MPAGEKEPAAVKQPEKLKPPSVPSPLEESLAELEKLSSEAKLPGRGGDEHTALQSYIKGIAQQAGFKANEEQPTPDGSGNVDVLAMREGETIAFEVMMTSSLSTVSRRPKSVKGCRRPSEFL